MKKNITLCIITLILIGSSFHASGMNKPWYSDIELKLGLCGHPIEVFPLLPDGVKIDNQHRNDIGLLVAANRGNLEATQYYIAQKADLNFKDKLGRTALMFAAYKKYHNIINVLITAGANLEIQDNNGETAFMRAKGQECLRLLQKAGTKINALDNNGNNAFSGHIGLLKDEEAKFMIEAGIDWSIAIKNQDKDTGNPFYVTKYISQFLKLTAKQKQEIYALLFCLKNVSQETHGLVITKDMQNLIAKTLFTLHKQNNEQRVRTVINAVDFKMTKNVLSKELEKELNKEVIHENK